MVDNADPGTLPDDWQRLLTDEADDDVAERVARAWVAAMADGRDLTRGLDAADRGALVRRLVVQDGLTNDPPALHTAIANYVSGGVPEVLATAVRQIGTDVVALAADDRPPKNVVLLLVLLRSELTDLLPQDDISRLHLAAVGEFTTGDVTLPYSTAFTDRYDRNRDDVRGLFDRSVPGRGLEGLPLPHLLVFEWLIGRAGGARRTIAARASAPTSSSSTTTADDARAAARSLLLRHRLVDELADPPPGLLDDAVLDVDARIAAARPSLPGTRGDALAVAPSHRVRRLESRTWQAARAGIGLVDSRAPVRLARRRPRVAVCVSGQLRGYREGLDSWRRTILASAECDVFLHTWDRVGRSGGEVFRATLPFAGDRFTAAYRETANGVPWDEFRGRYPGLFATLAGSDTVDAEALRDLYNTPHVVVEDDTAPPRDTWTNQDKMHAKIQAAFDLVGDALDDYDLVVRLRPDKPLQMTAFGWSDVLDVCRSSPTVLADAPYGVHYAHLVIGDQFAMGAPATMTVYSRTWTTYPALASAGLFDCGPEFAGHSSLAQVCWTHGLDVRRAPIRFGALAEAERMSSPEILTCLRDDASGRDDEIDRRLIAAVRADLDAG